MYWGIAGPLDDESGVHRASAANPSGVDKTPRPPVAYRYQVMNEYETKA